MREPCGDQSALNTRHKHKGNQWKVFFFLLASTSKKRKKKESNVASQRHTIGRN